MTIIVASQLIWGNGTENLRVRMDCGKWMIESDAAKGPVQRLEIDPEAMDRLVESWPEFRKMAADPPKRR